MKWFVKCLRNYVSFEGRARRSEFWYFVLFSFLFLLVARIIDALLFKGTALLSSLLWLGLLLPYISVSVRRLHDTGRSGKLLLAYYVFGFILSVLVAYFGLQSLSDLLNGAEVRLSTAQLVVLGTGGVINFVMDIENLSYPDAVRFLAKRANIPVPEEASDGTEKLRRRMLELNRDAARWYYQTLQAPEGQAVRDYLDRRQIHRRIAVRFGMGAAPDSWDALLTAMTARGYSKDELIRAGLAVSGKSGHIYDKFRNRLILPVLDKSEPKYMNTPETLTYSKRRVLYGLNLAKKTKRPNIILCEGNLDVVTLHQAGFDNAVASMGTALTVEQTRLLSRYTKELVLCYDNDKAGALATQRALEPVGVHRSGAAAAQPVGGRGICEAGRRRFHQIPGAGGL